MYYSEELVEEIRQKNDIVDVISGYVRIQKKGGSHFGLCPFHNEKSPSFSVTQGKQMYYCFGCGAGGNVFTFVMEYENFSFQEAIQFLAQRASVDLPEVEYSEETRKKESKRSKLLEINKEAAKFYFYQLRSEQGVVGYEYLRGRQLSEETTKKFGLGYATKYSNSLLLYLRKRGYADDLMKDAGLIGFDEKTGMHDKFWNRVMFPIQDINHRVIGFGGRVMGDAKPKYLNSPETDIFDKGRNLYGLNFARTSKKNHLIVCEGYMDVIAMHQAGFTQAVASLGTAFTSGHASLLRRYTQEVLLLYDSDEAGTKATLRALPILKEAGISGKVVSLEPYKDPDDLINAVGAEEFEIRIKNAENSFFYEIRILEKDFDLKDPEGKTRFHREIAQKLCLFLEEVERENYMQAIAEKYFIGFENLKKLVISYAAKTGLVTPAVRPKSGIQEKNLPKEAVKKAQRLLLTWLSEEVNLYQKIEKYISMSDFTNELYAKVAENLFIGLQNGNCNPASIVSLFTGEEEQREVASIFNTKLMRLETTAEREKAFHDILIKVKKNSLEHHSQQLGSDMHAIEKVIESKKMLEELEKTHISLI